MKLDITKTNIKYNNCSGLPFEIQFLKDIKEGHSCLRLYLLGIKQGEKRKRCHPKSDYPILTSNAFLNQKHNKQTMDNRRPLIVAAFHFVHPVETSQVDTKVCQLQLEPAVRSGDTGQWISCFASCQLITTLVCN